MAEDLGQAVLELTTDDTKLKQGLSAAERTAESTAKSAGQKFSGGISKGALPAAAALGLVAVGAKRTIDAASDLGEQVNKTGVVFGENAKEVHAWSQGLTKNFGMSQRAALEAAGTYGNMLKPMGVLPAKVKEISVGMVELAGDMASFNNASPQETLDALRAGLAGETEPLRRFGVFLSEATIQAEAVSSGIVKLEQDTTKIKLAQLAAETAQKAYTKAVKEYGLQSKEAQTEAVKMEVAESRLGIQLAGKVPKLSAAEKALASYQIITRSTKDAQGDFAKTADSVANAERVQAAETENLNAKLGKGLMPAYQMLQKVLLGVTGFMSEHTTATKIGVGIVAGLAVAVLAVNAALKVAAIWQPIVTAATWLWNAALSANSIGLVVIALAALAAGFVIAYNKSETFRGIVDGLWGKLKALGSWVKEHWGTISSVIEKSPMVLTFKAMATAIGKVVDAVKWLIGNIPTMPSLPGLPGFLGGTERGQRLGLAEIPSSVTGGLGSIASIGAQHGLVVTSGFRPGDPGDHGKNKARDISNTYRGDPDGTPEMDRAFLALAAVSGQLGIKDLLYTPGLWKYGFNIDNGRRAPFSVAGHSDHIHASVFDQGGWLPPGLTLAANLTGRPERILGPGEGGQPIVVNVAGSLWKTGELAEELAYALERSGRAGGVVVGAA